MAKFPELNWNAKDMSEELQLFKQRMELCLLDHGITDKEKQSTKITLAVGIEGLRKLNAATGMSEEDKKDPDKIWHLFESQLQVKVNYRVHRLELMRYRQKQGETLDDFCTRCKEKARECDFTNAEMAERIIELVISSTPFELFQKDLLEKEKGYTLENMLAEGRKYESMSKNRRHLQSLGAGTDIETNAIDMKKPCGNCGLAHRFKHCPAYRDKCDKCGRKGHWAKMCRKYQTKL